MNHALPRVKTDVGGTFAIQRQQRTVGKPLRARYPFRRPVVGAQALRQLGLPEPPAASGRQQKHQPFQHVATRQAAIVKSTAGQPARQLPHLLTQVFYLLPRPLIFVVLLIPLLPAGLLLRTHAPIAEDRVPVRGGTQRLTTGFA